MALRVAIVGCGKIADAHAEEIRKLDGRAELVAVCDRELLIAEQLARRFAVPAFYDSFSEMLERERPDVVHLTTPPHTHLPLAREALVAGCNVYVEKPFALNRAESAELIAAAEAQRRVVTVGYFSYFDPAALLMRRLIAEGALGTPVHVESFYGYDLSGPFGSVVLAEPSHWVRQLPGKLLQNVIDHMLNKVAEFIPDENPALEATGYSRHPAAKGAFEDELRVLIRGAETSGYATFSSHIRPTAQFVRVYGTQNTLRVDYVARTVTLEEKPKLPTSLGRLLVPFQESWGFLREAGRNAWRFARSDFHYFDGLRVLLSGFYDAIEKGSPPPIAYADILRVSSWMDEIFRQLAQGKAA